MPSDDYASTTATTGTLQPGGSVSGLFESSYDSDWFAITLTAGQTYDFSATTSSASSPYLSLYDLFGHWLTSGDSYYYDNNGDFSYTAPFTLIYYLAISDYSYPGGGGSYTLTASTGYQVVDDYPATTATTGTLQPGGSVSGDIEISNDSDWFAISLTAGQTYTFGLTPAASGGLRDPYLELYDAAGNWLTYDDDSGGNLNSSLLYTAETTGLHYLAPRAYSTGTGVYLLTATAGEVVVDDFTADTSTSGTLAIGGTTSGEIELRNDSDWFAVTLEEGYAYTFDLVPQSSGSTYFYPSLELYDGSGNWVAYASDYTSDWDPQLFHLATASGNYYLAVNSWYSGTGTYSLVSHAAQELRDDHPASSATTGSVTVGGSTQGSIDYRYDTDWLAVTLTAGETYAFDLNGTDGGLGDPYLSLYDADGNWLSYDDDSGPGLDSHLVYAATTTGTHYLEARAYSSGTGAYELSAALTDETPDDRGGPIIIHPPWYDWETPHLPGILTGSALAGGAASGTLAGTGGVDALDVSQYAWSNVTLARQTNAQGGEEWNLSYSGSTSGTDTLLGVERLQFQDTYVALDLFSTEDPAGAVLALYYAGFDTLPDAATMGQWIYAADTWSTGASATGSLVTDLAQVMLDHYLPSGMANSELVELLYTNIMGAAPTPEESAPYLEILESGTLTQAQLAAAVAASTPNTGQYGEQITQGIAYTPVGTDSSADSGEKGGYDTGDGVTGGAGVGITLVGLAEPLAHDGAPEWWG